MKLITFVVATLSTLGVASPSAALNFPARGRAAVVDAAHILPPADAAALNRRVVAWDRATGHQLAIATIPSLQGTTIADYGYQMGRAWGLGRKGIDDGILFLIAPSEHKVRIDVGRGLEGDLTDAETSVILSGTVVPKLKAGDVAGAVSGGAEAIMSVVPAGAGDTTNAPPPTAMGWLGWLLIALGTSGLVAVGAVMFWFRREHRRFEQRMASAHRDIAATRSRIDLVVRANPTSFSLGARPPAQPGRNGPSSRSRASSPAIVPVIIPETYTPSPPSDTSNWGSSDSGSSGSDFGSSGFDSGGGSFSGGGSDSSW